MALVVVSVPSGGLPVTIAPAGVGMPMIASTNGYGVAVTQVPNGIPIADVAGNLFGPPVAPVNISPPVISGVTQTGQTLMTSSGGWSGSAATFTYQWKRGGVNVSGATSSVYLLTAADSGAMMTVTVTATNSAGNASATAAAVGPVTITAVVYPPLTCQAGLFTLTGEDMTPIAGYAMQADIGLFQLAGQSATLTPPAASIALTDSKPSTATGSVTIDYGPMNYNAGNSRVIVAIQWTYNGGGQVITGVTVGGVALTQVAGAFNSAGGGTGSSAIDVWISSAPLSGSSGDVRVTANQAFPWYSAAAVYSLHTGSPVRADVAIGDNGNGATVSANINVPSGGVGIALASGSNGALLSSFTPVFVDATETPPGRAYVFGHTTATGAITVTANFSPDQLSLTTVSWGP